MGNQLGDFHPCPKPKPRDKTKKKKKKLETFKGRTIPPKKARGTISKTQYEKAIEEFGSTCVYCHDPYIEMHHIIFRSQGGRGQYRNLIPLCKKHHALAHSSRTFADLLREERVKRYGQYYGCDKYDLFKLGLIPNSTDEAFTKFMIGQEKGNKSPI